MSEGASVPSAGRRLCANVSRKFASGLTAAASQFQARVSAVTVPSAAAAAAATGSKWRSPGHRDDDTRREERL